MIRANNFQSMENQTHYCSSFSYGWKCGRQASLSSLATTSPFNFKDYQQKSNMFDYKYYIDKQNIDSKDKSLLKRYLNMKTIQGLTDRRIMKLAHTIVPIARMTVINKLTPVKLEHLLLKISNLGFKDSTKYDYFVDLRNFMEAMDMKNLAKRIPTPKIKDIKREWFSPEQIDFIIKYNAQKDIKLACFLRLFYDSGCRPEEFNNLRFCDIEKKKVTKKGKTFVRLIFNVSGKTGQRPVPIYSYNEYKEYIKGRKINQNWFFCSFDTKPLSYKKFADMVKSAIIRAGFNQPAKSFRRSRVTELLNLGMHPQKIKKMFGWSNSSKMVDYYPNYDMLDVYRDMDNIYLQNQQDS